MQRSQRGAARYCLSVIPLTQDILAKLRAWEYGKLRSIFKFGRKPEETWQEHLERSAAWVRRMWTRYNIPTTAEWVLRSYFRHCHKSVRSNSLHEQVRSSRSRLWWVGTKGGPYKLRKLHGETKTHNCSRVP